MKNNRELPDVQSSMITLKKAYSLVILFEGNCERQNKEYSVGKLIDD